MGERFIILILLHEVDGATRAGGFPHLLAG